MLSAMNQNATLGKCLSCERRVEVPATYCNVQVPILTYICSCGITMDLVPNIWESERKNRQITYN